MALFQAAKETGQLKPVELMCLKNAVVSFEQLLLPGKLFVNMSHELFLAGNHLRKQLTELTKNSPVPAYKIVIELTEQSATSDLDKLIEAARFFHGLGYQIAIDDLGVGQISHTDWMKLEPDYVKVSRQFINNIEKDQEKMQVVKSIVSAARSARAKVIALGIETEEELAQVSKLGISLCEGYLFQRPQLSPEPSLLKPLNATFSDGTDKVFACDFAENQNRYNLSTSLSDVMNFFDNNTSYTSVVVEHKDRVLGLLKRSAFFESINRFDVPELTSLEEMEDIIENDVAIIDAYTELLPLSKMLIERSRAKTYDDFIVFDGGVFLGVGTVIDVMRQLIINKAQVTSKKESNVPELAAIE